MPHIQLNNDAPGIRSLVLYRPDTGQPLYELAQALLRAGSPGSTLVDAERELIAAYVSSRNCTDFCQNSHAAAARFLYGDNQSIVDQVLTDVDTASLSPKMKALLSIAEHVQTDARTVSTELVETARQYGATDGDVHDTVLIAASFCMYNRYVDGLATLTPADPAAYMAMGERMGTLGYVIPQSGRTNQA
ncbi:carboxymuconolactone decarboxylase family protein [Fibrella forsythiae]|uniref:Carboxymuconolactone decarboxylase family protein n=1 Tax=Fibrella forsythiae TaxID=2817061 RepID=A0ABS3JMA9_9BACT|nr:carboxymuconolactone decarboxylase family protein [Fibrella forsythiae]MBO0951141.1 carboxymuconolactone decarboxylase family protein [Fibrella forsythiae]